MNTGPFFVRAAAGAAQHARFAGFSARSGFASARQHVALRATCQHFSFLLFRTFSAALCAAAPMACQATVRVYPLKC
jgi:hypothetical protein